MRQLLKNYPQFKSGQKIYALSTTGKIKVWWCEVVRAKNFATITTSRALGIDGKVVALKETIKVGKNLGRTNETSPYQQAQLEVGSKYRAKFLEGYDVVIPASNAETGLNSLGFLKPMLSPNKIPVPADWPLPAYWQPKLDGHRAMVVKTAQGITMYTRKGKVIDTMDHITSYLEDYMSEGEYLDGELYIHNMPLNQIGSLIKKDRGDASKQVKLIVYDAPHRTAIFRDRLTKYEATISSISFDDADSSFEEWVDSLSTNPAPVLPCFTSILKTTKAIQTQLMEAISLGFEGGMLRATDMVYKPGGREKFLMKLKLFDDSEFKIIRVEEGKRYVYEDIDIPQACFICELPNNEEFEVAAPGTKQEKAKIWRNRKKMVGLLCTVKHSGYTEYGKPWHPIAKCVRMDI